MFVGPTLGSKSKAELRHKSFTTPGALYHAGLTVSIITDAPVIPLEKLPMCAGLAANAGLPMEEAWRAITINPARSLGIDSRVGSLEPGKDADLVLWTADPLTTIGAEGTISCPLLRKKSRKAWRISFDSIYTVLSDSCVCFYQVAKLHNLT